MRFGVACDENRALTTPSHSDENGIAHRTRRGISWNLIGAIATNAARLVSVAVLGRVLERHDFGVVAAALSVLLVVHQLRDLGIGAALVQRADLDREHVSTAFAFSIYLGCVLGLVVVVAAPLIGALYKISDSIDVLRALGLLFVFRGLSTVPLMMCRRAMNFRAIAAVDTGTYTGGTIVTLTLAINGAGPWSLVAGYLTEEALSAACYLYLQPPKLSLRIDRTRLRDLLGFGVGHTVVQVANILAIHGDNFVVGRTLGADALGFYTRAYELIKLPASVFTNVVGNVLLPAFSRLQNDRERLAMAFRRATLVNALVLLPASAALIAIAPEAIRVVMGEQWDDAVLPFRILALSMLMRTSYKVGATIAAAAGSVYAVAVANIVYMVSVIAGAAFTIRWGVPGVAASTAVAIVVVYLHCSYLAMRVAAVSPRDFLAAHAPGCAIAVIVGCASWPAAEALRSAGSPSAVTFAAIGLFGVAIVIAACVAWLRPNRGARSPLAIDAGWLREEISQLLRRVRRRRDSG